MKPLLSALNDIPEYRSLLAAIDNGGLSGGLFRAVGGCTAPILPRASARS